MNDVQDDKLMADAQRLSKAETPGRDLWPDIAASIAAPVEATQQRRWMPLLAQAAAVVLLVGGSSTITYFVMKDDGVRRDVAPELLFENTSFGTTDTLSPAFQEARKALVTDLEAELVRLPEETRVTIEANLKLVRQAIFETNSALKEEPDNAALQARLLRAYREEVALLRRVNGISRNVMMRNDI